MKSSTQIAKMTAKIRKRRELDFNLVDNMAREIPLLFCNDQILTLSGRLRYS